MHPNIRFCINGEGDAAPRLSRVDCEISFAARRDDLESDWLFADYVLPMCSPVNIARTAGLESRLRLEGFPLIHLDFYKDDPAGLAWPDWVVANAAVRSAPERGLRFQRIGAALDAIDADVGVALVGLALLREPLDAGTLGLPFPMETGRWSAHGFVARYRADSQGRPHIQQFRAWLAGEAQATGGWLAAIAPPP